MVSWIGRLPAAFLKRFAVFAAAYLLIVAAAGAALVHPFSLVAALGVVAASLIATAFFAAGLLVPYNLTVRTYRRCALPLDVQVLDGPRQTSEERGLPEQYSRIGLILAGGGAKGAYQAGAMKAVYEFLDQKRALDRVVMIAGTSIGAWNAMFWLGGLVSTPANGRSIHERWWRSISLDAIAKFDIYTPFKHSVFKTTPWEQTFMQIFRDAPEVKAKISALMSSKPGIHFYFTRTNVEKGRLEFATNRSSISELRRPASAGGGPLIPGDVWELLDRPDFDRLQRAVFASMDLPLLFPYAVISADTGQSFEDGGVVANLPVWFGTRIAGCNLLFVLALNSSFTAPAPRRSMAKRLLRVLDIRQGILEMQALKEVYVYNEKIGLENELKQLKGFQQMEPTSVFAVCPGPPLLLDTTDFWAAECAGKAFTLMYNSTRTLLQDRFEELAKPTPLTISVINGQGEAMQREIF